MFWFFCQRINLLYVIRTSFLLYSNSFTSSALVSRDVNYDPTATRSRSAGKQPSWSSSYRLAWTVSYLPRFRESLGASAKPTKKICFSLKCLFAKLVEGGGGGLTPPTRLASVSYIYFVEAGKPVYHTHPIPPVSPLVTNHYQEFHYEKERLRRLQEYYMHGNYMQ